MDGFIPLCWDVDEGEVWMEISRFDEELLHYTSLPAGLGQDDLGLNRGDLGPAHVVVFRRVGPRVLMEEPNPRSRPTRCLAPSSPPASAGSAASARVAWASSTRRST